MAGTMEGLSTINSFLRTLVAIVVVGAIAVGGWFGYSKFNAGEIEAQKKAAELKDANEKLAKATEELEVADAEIARQSARIAEQQTQINDLNVQVKKLETSLAFLKVDHRVAKFTALDQTKDEATGDITTLIEFVEVNDEGVPIDTPRQFRLPGDTVYIDSWVVRFKDEFVEQNDLERGSSLMLFKRVFGSGQKTDRWLSARRGRFGAAGLCAGREAERFREEDLGQFLGHRQRPGPSGRAGDSLRQRRRAEHEGRKGQDLRDPFTCCRRPGNAPR